MLSVNTLTFSDAGSLGLQPINIEGHSSAHNRYLKNVTVGVLRISHSSVIGGGLVILKLV